MQFWIMIYSNSKMYSLVTHAVYKGRDIAENIHYPRYTQAPGVIYISHYKIFFFILKKIYANGQVPVQLHLISYWNWEIFNNWYCSWRDNFQITTVYRCVIKHALMKITFPRGSKGWLYLPVMKLHFCFCFLKN